MTIFFMCSPHGPAEKSNYQHQVVALAEGMTAEGLSPKGNLNYWRKSVEPGDFLIREYQPADLNEFDVVVLSSHQFRERQHMLPHDPFSAQRNYKLILIDDEDGRLTAGFEPRARAADLVLKSHFCSAHSYPDNFVPWQFGLTDRIVHYTQQHALHFNARNKQILSNFRVEHSARHAVEELLREYFYPLYPKNSAVDAFNANQLSPEDLLFWTQTGRRHYPSFYKRLGENLMSNAVGGYLEKSIENKKGLMYKVLRRLDASLGFFPFASILQFDSWRFWESLASGSCTLHLDLEKYGIRLPEMPVNGLHYIGIDLDEPRKALEMCRDEEQLRNISAAGREWVLQHYSPRAVFNRFRDLVEKI